MRKNGYILGPLAAAILAVVTAAPATAADDGPSLRKPPSGSIAAQLRLKFMLKAQAEGSLVAAINHNRQDWDALSPDQRDQYRRSVVAFLNKPPQEQEKLLENFDRLVALPADKQQQYRDRATWLKAVMDRLSPAERQELLSMTPEDRARVLVAKRDQLRREGVLPPATASAPTTTRSARD